MKKRILAMILAVALLCSFVQTTSLATTSLTEAELHVSDEFAAAYPNGYFDLATAAIQAQEYSGRMDIEVVRSGGTAGSVVLTLKAIDITTSDGDYALDVMKVLREESPTHTPLPERSSPPGLSTVPRSTGLRAVREAATGTTSDRIQYTEQEKTEMVQTAREAVGDYYANAPGTEFTLVFEPGERSKSFGIEIINDEIPEAEEQLVLVISSVSGGAVLGDQRETILTIVDDEAMETPVLKFSAQDYIADNNIAEVTLVRSAGLNYYAGGTVLTLDGSAVAGTDYTATKEDFLFLPGQETLTVSIPVAENTSGEALDFVVQALSNGSCTISGSDSAKVTIPSHVQCEEPTPALLSLSNAEVPVTPAVANHLLSGDDSMLSDTETPVTLGVGSITYYGNRTGANGVEANFTKVGNLSAIFKRTTADWYEVKITNNQMKSGLQLKRALYKNLISSIKTDITLYECGHERNFDVDIMTELKQSSATHSNRLISGRNGYDDRKNNLNIGYGSVNTTAPFSLSLYIQNGNRDYGAIRLHSLTLNFKHYKLEVAPAQDTVYTFDFATGTATPTPVEPGAIEIRDGAGRLVKAFYTSDNSTALTVSTKNVQPGYYLKELRLYNNQNVNIAGYKTVEMGKTGGTLIIDSAFMNNYGSYTVSGNTFLIQPVFVRDEATLTVSIAGADRGKGSVSGVTFPDTTGDASKTYTKNNNLDSNSQITLHVGDTINLVGVGSGNTAVTGFYLSRGDGSISGKKIEAFGAENAGIISFSLDKTNTVTPIFGDRSFFVSRDPDADEGLTGNFSMGISGEAQGGVTFTKNGELIGVKSGQELNVLVVPPDGYTTQWTNRSGDTNGNGILDDEEIRDENGNLYLRYDYNGDGELDADYKNTLYGDFLRTRINQPQSQFYYSFVPLSGPFHTGQVTGYLKTYEYDIYHGYATAVDRNGVTIKKLVPVSDASVVMGGSYNKDAEGADPSYATSTDSKGKFIFEVTKVLKNSPYFFSIRNGTASFYTDYITPSLSGSNYVIPLFSSMRPVRISASSTSGKSTVSGSVITLNKDTKVTFDLEVASLESNIAVEQVKFNVYSEDGTQRFSSTAGVAYGMVQYEVVADKTFEAGDTLKVVLVDQNRNETIEYNTGYEFRPSIKSPVGLPSFVSPVESVVLPLFQSVAGGLNLGSVSTEVPAVGDTYTIRLGAEKAFEGSEKILHETTKSGADSGTVKKEIAEKNSKAATKEDSNVKTKTSVSSKMAVQVSLELVIKYDSTAKNYYFGSLQMMVTLNNDSVLHHETSVTLPIGLTIVAKLDIGGEVTGFLKISPVTRVGSTSPLKNYMDEYGNFEYTDSNMFKDDNYRFYFEGGLIIQPKIFLAIEGNYSIGSVVVDGSAQFRLLFTTSNRNSGVVTLKAGISVKTFGIEVYSKNFGSVEYNLFGSDYLFALEDHEATEEFEFFAPVDVSGERSSWLGEDLLPQNPGPGSYGFTEATLLSGVYPDPDIQTMRIDKNRLLMVYIDAHADRDAYNKSALYYSVSNNNGESYGTPIPLNDDGTTDSMPCLIDLGDRIACLYSTISAKVSSDTRMEELLEQAELEMLFFNKETLEWSQTIRVTEYSAIEDDDGSLVGDYFTNSHATVAYDAANHKLLILYMKSDYTSDENRTFRAADLFDTSENGYYSTIAYRIYDTSVSKFLSYGEIGYPKGVVDIDHIYWDTCFYGQLFPDTSVSGIADPLVLDITAAYKGGVAYLAYTVDTDNNLETAEDRDVYLMTYSYDDNEFSSAVKASDIYPGNSSTTVNERPQFATYDNKLYLFYTSDSSVYYVDADLLLNHEADDWNEAGGAGTVDKTHIDLLPKTANIALDGTDKENAPADYQVLLGDDSKLYLVWTEPTLRYADGVEPGTPESLLDGNNFNERQIYASIYYSYNDVDEEDIAPAGYGTWSGKVQLTAGPGKYSDVSAAVMGDGHILLLSKKEYLDSNAPPQLVAMTLLPALRAEMTDDIAFGTDYPIIGETTSLTASFQNLSLMALSDVSMEFSAVQNGIQTLIGTVALEQAVCGGEKVEAGIDFTVPENPAGLSIRAKLSASDPNTGKTTLLATNETVFPYSAGLDFNLLRMTHVAQDYFSLYAEILHTGNKPLTEATLILSLEEHDGILREIKRTSLNEDVLTEALITVNETFTLSNSDLKAINGVVGGSANLNARIVSGEEILISRQDTVTKNLSDSYGDTLTAVSAVNLMDDKLSLHRGETHTLTPTVTTALEEGSYTIAYRSSDTSVATISDSGIVKAHKTGSVTITAYAIPDVAMRIISEDGFGKDGSLFDALSLEDFSSDNVELTVLSSGSYNPPATTVDSIHVAASTLREQADNGQGLVLTVNDVVTTFDNKAVREFLALEQGMVTLSVTKVDNSTLSPEVLNVIGSRPVYTFIMKSGDRTISQLGGEVEVNIPYTLATDEDPNALVVYYLNASGALEVVPNCRYNTVTGRVIFRTNHFSKYAIGYNLTSFADVQKSAWYTPAVRFLSAREITSGTSATTFSPAATLTRGQFITLLLRAYGIVERTGDNFSDAGDSYYTGYLAAAKQLSISNGVGNNKFAPGQPITRQEMFTLLYNALKVLDRLPQGDLGKTLSDFKDSSSIAPYALEAMTYLVEVGTISGSNGMLDPSGGSTRAQMAQVLYNLLSK